MYSPKISEDLIPVLYQLKLRLDKPMTEIVDGILREELHEMEEIYLKKELEVKDASVTYRRLHHDTGRT